MAPSKESYRYPPTRSKRTNAVKTRTTVFSKFKGKPALISAILVDGLKFNHTAVDQEDQVSFTDNLFGHTVPQFKNEALDVTSSFIVDHYETPVEKPRKAMTLVKNQAHLADFKVNPKIVSASNPWEKSCLGSTNNQPWSITTSLIVDNCEPPLENCHKVIPEIVSASNPCEKSSLESSSNEPRSIPSLGISSCSTKTVEWESLVDSDGIREDKDATRGLAYKDRHEKREPHTHVKERDEKRERSPLSLDKDKTKESRTHSKHIEDKDERRGTSRSKEEKKESNAHQKQRDEKRESSAHHKQREEKRGASAREKEREMKRGRSPRPKEREKKKEPRTHSKHREDKDERRGLSRTKEAKRESSDHLKQSWKREEEARRRSHHSKEKERERERERRGRSSQWKPKEQRHQLANHWRPRSALPVFHRISRGQDGEPASKRPPPVYRSNWNPMGDAQSSRSQFGGWGRTSPQRGRRRTPPPMRPFVLDNLLPPSPPPPPPAKAPSKLPPKMLTQTQRIAIYAKEKKDGKDEAFVAELLNELNASRQLRLHTDHVDHAPIDNKLTISYITHLARSVRRKLSHEEKEWIDTDKMHRWFQKTWVAMKWPFPKTAGLWWPIVQPHDLVSIYLPDFAAMDVVNVLVDHTFYSTELKTLLGFSERLVNGQSHRERFLSLQRGQRPKPPARFQYRVPYARVFSTQTEDEARAIRAKEMVREQQATADLHSRPGSIMQKMTREEADRELQRRARFEDQQRRVRTLEQGLRNEKNDEYDELPPSCPPNDWYSLPARLYSPYSDRSNYLCAVLNHANRRFYHTSQRYRIRDCERTTFVAIQLQFYRRRPHVRMGLEWEEFDRLCHRLNLRERIMKLRELPICKKQEVFALSEDEEMFWPQILDWLSSSLQIIPTTATLSDSVISTAVDQAFAFILRLPDSRLESFDEFQRQERASTGRY